MPSFAASAQTYYSFDPTQYNRLFDEELEKVIQRVQDPAHRQILERMRGFNWVGYIAASVRHAGYRDQRQVQERTHDIVVKLLTGTLFAGFDERTSWSDGFEIQAVSGKRHQEHRREREEQATSCPTVPIGQTFGSVTADELPARSWTAKTMTKRWSMISANWSASGSVKSALPFSMCGWRAARRNRWSASPEVGGKGRYVIKRVVQQIKALAREYAASLGDSELLRRIEKAMAGEEETVEKRRTAMRRAVGA